MANKDEVCFRYKKADGTMVYCHIPENKLWEEDAHLKYCMCIDVDDTTIKKLIDILQSMPTYEDYRPWQCSSKDKIKT